MELQILIEQKSRNKKLIYPPERPKRQDWILHLLKSQKATIEMICAFADVTEHSARQMIVNLRKEGYHISKIDHEFYEYFGFKK